jgi:hypothetical protein
MISFPIEVFLFLTNAKRCLYIYILYIYIYIYWFNALTIKTLKNTSNKLIKNNHIKITSKSVILLFWILPYFFSYREFLDIV